uniref:Uncharacterized protein n=1 Tax=Romanomermis culicivorax TaxID=13658 RepID=A0A915HVJ1_ROMCU
MLILLISPDHHVSRRRDFFRVTERVMSRPTRPRVSEIYEIGATCDGWITKTNVSNDRSTTFSNRCNNGDVPGHNGAFTLCRREKRNEEKEEKQEKKKKKKKKKEEKKEDMVISNVLLLSTPT